MDHEGRRFEGHDGVRGFFAEFTVRGEEFRASPFTFELHEPDLLVVGHRRIKSDEGLQGDYLFFVHSVRDGRVSRREQTHQAGGLHGVVGVLDRRR